MWALHHEFSKIHVVEVDAISNFTLTRRFHDEKTILSIHRLRSPNERNFGYFSTSTFSREKSSVKSLPNSINPKLSKK